MKRKTPTNLWIDGQVQRTVLPYPGVIEQSYLIFPHHGQSIELTFGPGKICFVTLVTTGFILVVDCSTTTRATAEKGYHNAVLTKTIRSTLVNLSPGFLNLDKSNIITPDRN